MRVLFVFLFVFVNYPLLAQSRFCITGVTVLPMTGTAKLTNRTIWVEEGIITAIEEGVPKHKRKGYRYIDGQGKFILPGLINSYTHASEAVLPMYLAFGVTTIRDIPGNLLRLGLKKRVQSGDLLSPRIYSIGPPASGRPAPFHSQQPVITSQEAAEYITELKRLGYDGAMIYGSCDPGAYSYILEEGHKQSFPIGGHWPAAVNRQTVLAGNQSSLENFSGLLTGGNFRFHPDTLVQMLKNSGKAIIPTLTIHKVRYRAYDRRDSLTGSPRLDYVFNKEKASWATTSLISNRNNHPYPALAQTVYNMYRAGIPLLIGSDDGFPFVVHGFSYLDELKNFEATGIPRQAILEYATVKAAQFLRNDSIGVIAVGKKADLLLLGADPAENLDNLLQLEGVWTNGRYLDKAWVGRAKTLLKQAVSDPESLRFAGFETEKEAMRDSAEKYLYTKAGAEVGEEYLLYKRSDDRNFTIESLSGIDDPLGRTIYMMSRVRNGLIDSVYVKMKGADGITSGTITRKNGVAMIEGNAAIHGPFSYRIPVTAYTHFSGPFSAYGLDINTLGSYLPAVLTSSARQPGQAEIRPDVQLEFNSEEWGDRYVLDQSDMTILKHPGTGQNRYSVIHPGFSSERAITSGGIHVELMFNTNGTLEKLSSGDILIQKITNNKINK